MSEWIVREYFEALGFWVRQPRKYAVAARAKRPDEEVDLLVFNPKVKKQAAPRGLLWSSAEVARITRAVVGVRGWHTDRFSQAVLERAPEVYRFAADDVAEQVALEFGAGPVMKILCLPGFPASDASKYKALEILREKGVDGVLPFRTMLLELVSHVEANRSYEKSDVLQLLRILKCYDLLKGPQLELFRGKTKRR